MGDQLDRGPLTEAVYYILLSVMEPLHGYGIMQRVKEMSDGRLNLGAGTLYGAITTLLEKEWIIPDAQETDTRKKSYLVTAMGKERIEMEILRLRELLNNGTRILEEKK